MTMTVMISRNAIMAIRKGFGSAERRARLKIKRDEFDYIPTPGERLRLVGGGVEVEVKVDSFLQESNPQRFNLVLHPTPLPE